MRRFIFGSILALTSASICANAGEVVRASVQPNAASETHANQTNAPVPQPAPFKFLYQYPIYPQAKALRAQSSLDAFNRAAQTEGWNVSATKSVGTSHVVYNKKAGEKIADIVVQTLKGCVAYDEACRRYVENLNKRNAYLENLDAFAGQVLLPVQDVRLSVEVDAGANYRESKSPNGQVYAIISKKLNTISSIISKHAVTRVGSICVGDCINLYSLKVE